MKKDYSQRDKHPGREGQTSRQLRRQKKPMDRQTHRIDRHDTEDTNRDRGRV